MTAPDATTGPSPFVPGTQRIRVPASSANLGPGFDSFGLALALYDEIAVAVAPDGVEMEGVEVSVSGQGAGTLALDETHLVVSAMLAAFREMGLRPPGLMLRCENAIPHGRGLGSSAAAIVAGVLAARSVVVDGPRRLDAAAVLALATRLEGHPDNIAAALHGGFTVAWMVGSEPAVLRLEPAPGLVAVAFVPTTEVATRTARGLLPAQVPHGDAAANSARTALLTVALTSRPDLLLEATRDWLHQRYRAPAMPASAALVERLRSQGIAAVISGAGPTVLALLPHGDPQIVAALAPADFEPLVLAVESRGAYPGGA